ncbi:MAG: sensor histidine kinase [Acutalibacteraceae bacterium]
MSLAVEQNIKEIKEEGERRDRFVSDFSHELKTPMTAIMGYAQLLDSYELEPQERKSAAETVYREAKRLEGLSRQLLDLYVLRNESTEFEEIALPEIGEQLKSALKFLSEKYRVPFSVNFGSETVLANRELLLSLLYDLADNAFKASEPESPIEIYSDSEDCKVKITVRDRGRGIEKENLRLLTEPFFREDKSRSRAQGGAGLGLSLCKEIAEIHGTSLCFESEKGKGTAVSFTLRKGGAANENT